MKRYQGLAVVLILGVVVVIASITKSPSPSKKSSKSETSSQHNSSIAKSPAHEIFQDSQEPTPKKNSATRSMSRSAASQPEPVATQMAVRGNGRNFVKHEISPLKRQLSENELRPSDIVGGNWKLVTSLYAISTAQLSAYDQGAPVGEQNGFSFFEAGSTNLQENLFSNERPMVVYDSRLQAFGVLTGTVQIDLRKGADVAKFLQEHGAKLEHAFPETRTYYISSQEQPFNFVQFKNSLEQDSRVSRSEVEIVGRRYGKQ
jgi:hypothetical protein